MIHFAFLVALLFSPPQAPPAVEVHYRGTRQSFAADYLDSLAKLVEELAVGSGYAAQSSSGCSPQPTDLVVVVHYSPPLQITLHTPTPLVLHADRITLYDDEDLNEGWPLLMAFSADTSWSLVKYDGGRILDLLCSHQLEPLASYVVTSSCHLAPSRRRSPGESPNPPLQRQE